MLKAPFLPAALLLPAVLLLPGCVTMTADPKVMTSAGSGAAAAYDPSLKGNMCVRQVTGGEEPSFWQLVARIGNDHFADALKMSLKNADLLSEAAACRFPIDVNILGTSEIKFPDGLLTHQTVSNVNYKVFDKQKPILLETITASYTARTWSGPKRIPEARQGSIRENIGKFLQAAAGIRVSAP